MKTLSCPLLWAFALLSEILAPAAVAAMASIPLNYNSSLATATVWNINVEDLSCKPLKQDVTPKPYTLPKAKSQVFYFLSTTLSITSIPLPIPVPRMKQKLQFISQLFCTFIETTVSLGIVTRISTI